MIFFVLPDSSGAQLREPKVAPTKLTKLEAYVQLADQKGAARQKALEVQNLIANSQDFVNRRSPQKHGEAESARGLVLNRTITVAISCARKKQI